MLFPTLAEGCFTGSGCTGKACDVREALSCHSQSVTGRKGLMQPEESSPYTPVAQLFKIL